VVLPIEPRPLEASPVFLARAGDFGALVILARAGDFGARWKAPQQPEAAAWTILRGRA